MSTTTAAEETVIREGIEYVSPAEYARIIRKSAKTVYRYLDAGLIPGARRTPGGQHEIPVAVRTVSAG
ncbi:hypothetical protein [Gordonia sp. 852002-50395_SCH5434458]|uniref:hypothetical protein n=1 Tax=Gordonia sp. 852002-50395_SCH5434458 TaxID=1834090 RepID=UPI0012E8E6D4|nr:hypothetical protein [Gordonia sp. 852002-50395_SCH5434458]